jgi:Response regulators consisting of a CheY-like receiver domain and a winged-helix DNA-binding domain
MKKKILLVEDDFQYREFIRQILEDSGYYVESLDSPLDAMDVFEKDKFSLVISDLKMDTLDGVKFLKFIKKVDSNVRTMILTGMPSEETEQKAKELAIDKYMVKETRIDILLKSIEYLVLFSKEMLPQENNTISSISEKLVLDLDARVAYKGEDVVKLTTKQFELLRIFLEKKDLAISRDEIISRLWDTEFEEIDPRIVDGHIKDLRKKLNIHAIIAIRGFGYKWSEA